MPNVADRRLLDAGERAAFHGRPGDGIAPLQQFLRASYAGGADRAEARWLLGVCQAAAGQFGTAASQLQPLLQVPSDADLNTRHYAAAAAGTLASIHRQVGRHAEASEFDDWAAQVAPGDAQIQFDAALGQAADSVGLGDRDTALAFVTHARSLCSDEPRWWRERVRLGWVQSEVALMLDRPADAVAALNRSVQEAERVGAPRHVAKSLLFLGVAMQAAGDPTALATLGRSALLSESLGAWPLVWVTRGLLATWLQSTDPEEAERCRRSAEYAVRLIASDLPSNIVAEWTMRPDVAPLFRGG